MDSGGIKFKLSKFWVFRKKCLKNINYFLRFSKKKKFLVERKIIKRLESFNSKFTRFSTYFKPTQYKKWGQLKSNTPTLLLCVKKHYQIKKLKKIKIFSSYNNCILIRSNLEERIFNPFECKQIDEISDIFSKSTFVKWHECKDTKLKFPFNFKRNSYLYVKVSKIIKSDKLETDRVNLGFTKYKEFKKLQKKFLCNLIFVLHDYKILFFYFSHFLKKDGIFSLKINPVFYRSLFGLGCEIFSRENFLPKLNCSTLQKNKNKEFKNGYKQFSISCKKYRFLNMISDIVIFLYPERKSFFFFLATFEQNTGWTIIKLNSDFFKKISSNFFFENNLFPNPFLENYPCARLMFLKEVILILDLLLLNKNLKFRNFYDNSYFFPKTFYCNIFKHLKSIKNGCTFFNFHHPQDFFGKFFQYKKKSWYKNSSYFFWYIFSKFSPSFLISRILYEQIFQKIGNNLNLDYPNSNNEISKVKKFFFNLTAKNEKKNMENSKTQNKILIKKSFKKYDSKDCFGQKNTPILNLKFLQFSGFNTNLQENLRVRSFLLQKKKKKKDNTSCFRNNLKKNKSIIPVNALCKIGKIFNGLAKTNKFLESKSKKLGFFKIKIIKENADLQDEILNRSGFILLKKISLRLSFMDLFDVILLNKSIKNKYLQNFKVQSKNTKFEYLTNSDKIDFLFGNKFKKINQNIESLKNFIYRKENKNKGIFGKTTILFHTIKENLEFENFEKIKKEISWKIEKYLKDTIIFFLWIKTNIIPILKFKILQI